VGAAITAALAWGSTGTAHGEDADVAALRQELEAMKQSNRELQDRVNALEGKPGGAPAARQQPGASASPATANPQPPMTPVPAAIAGAAVAVEPVPAARPDAAPQTGAQATSAQSSVDPGKMSTNDMIVALRRNWGQVKRGQTETGIRELLGAPTKEMQINGKQTWYYYYPGIGSGSVVFSSDKRTSGFQPPSMGWGF
jgi:hypothetical protein